MNFMGNDIIVFCCQQSKNLYKYLCNFVTDSFNVVKWIFLMFNVELRNEKCCSILLGIVKFFKMIVFAIQTIFKGDVFKWRIAGFQFLWPIFIDIFSIQIKLPVTNLVGLLN